MGGSGRNPGVSCGVVVRNRALRYRGAEKEKEKQRFSCDRLCRRSARPKAVLDCGRAVGVTYDSLTLGALSHRLLRSNRRGSNIGTLLRRLENHLLALSIQSAKIESSIAGLATHLG